MRVLVTYDVCTTTKAGRRRLRRVARVCLDFGQRVQKSVFECSLGEADLTILRSQLLQEIKADEDSLRLYRLHSDFERTIECYGLDGTVDFDGPLVV